MFKNQPAVDMEEAVKIDGSENTGQLGDNSYIYTIVDESGKINLNQLTDESGIILSNLLANYGLDREKADEIVDSILDWRDADDLHRLHGAESDYYLSLPNPDKAKNANFDTVEEVLFVKGMTPEILYGNKEKPGIFDFLTIYSGTSKININAAPKEVIAALPGVTPEIADSIAELRTTNPEAQGAQETVQSVAGAAYAQMSSYITVAESSIFTVESTGLKKGESRGFTVKATISLSGEAGGLYQCLHYKSPAITKAATHSDKSL